VSLMLLRRLNDYYIQNQVIRQSIIGPGASRKNMSVSYRNTISALKNEQLWKGKARRRLTKDL
jgi:predicted nucleic acid-binding Zn ribbon protein